MRGLLAVLTRFLVRRPSPAMPDADVTDAPPDAHHPALAETRTMRVRYADGTFDEIPLPAD